MRKLLIVCFSLIAPGLTFAQGWQTDFEVAKQLASTSNKPIVLVFQGSDWCGPCIKLENEIWSTDEFTSYANENFIMLKADFPRKRKNALDPKQQEHNNKLAEIYNRNGYFPFVVVLDKNGKVLNSSGYKKVSPEGYIAILESYKK